MPSVKHKMWIVPNAMPANHKCSALLVSENVPLREKKRPKLTELTIESLNLFYANITPGL